MCDALVWVIVVSAASRILQSTEEDKSRNSTIAVAKKFHSSNFY